jgi:hypothetical protein
MKSFIDSVDVSTRSKRRKAMILVIELLKKIRHAEEQYMERIPLHLRSGAAYSAADYSAESILDGLHSLFDAY